MKLFISCGETSGDLYASKVVVALGTAGGWKCYGNGGQHMQQAGCELLCNVVHTSTIGFIEPLFKLRYFYKVWKKTIQFILKHKVSVVMIIDHQGFNIRLANWCKKQGISVVSFVAPQFWIWGNHASAVHFSGLCDIIFCIFQKEYDFYHNISPNNVVFLGHPLVHMVPRRVNSKKKIIGLFPGSRFQEIKRCLPIMLKSIHVLVSNDPTFIAKVAVASPKIGALIKKVLKQWNMPLEMVESSHDLMAEAKVSVVTSGTVSLEHALVETPCVVIYRFSWLSYWVARPIVLKKLKMHCHGFFALPNILAAREICPELLQSQATVKNIVQSIKKCLQPQVQQKMRDDFKKIKNQLDNGPHIFRNMALELLSRVVHKQ